MYTFTLVGHVAKVYIFSGPHFNPFFSSRMFDSVTGLLSSKSSITDDWSDEGVEAISKAEERVRLAAEIAVNNSLARSRLAMTKIMRYVK